MPHHKTSAVLWVGLELEPSTGSDYIDVKTALTREFALTLAPSIEALVPSFKVAHSDYADPEPDVLQVVGDGIPGIGPQCFRYLKIEGEFDGVIPASYSNFDGELPEWWWKVALCQYLADAADIALQLSDLSHPGGVQCAGGAVKLGPAVHAKISNKYFMQELHLMKRKPGQWPELKTLSGADVVRWAVKIGLAQSHVATSRIQRTLAAYTQLVSLIMSGHNEKLFRAMQGLEAFYMDGKGDLQYQLSKKTAVWLGQRNDGGKLNAVTKLYEIRSKYVHGSASLNYWRTFRPAAAPYLVTAGEGQEYLEFAAQLLVATLQRCIELDVVDLNWRFEPVISCSSSSSGGD